MPEEERALLLLAVVLARLGRCDAADAFLLGLFRSFAGDPVTHRSIGRSGFRQSVHDSIRFLFAERDKDEELGEDKGKRETRTAPFTRTECATSECRCLRINNKGSTLFLVLFSDRKRIQEFFVFICFLRLLMQRKGKNVLYPAPTQLSSVSTSKLRDGGHKASGACLIVMLCDGELVAHFDSFGISSFENSQSLCACMRDKRESGGGNGHDRGLNPTLDERGEKEERAERELEWMTDEA